MRRRSSKLLGHQVQEITPPWSSPELLPYFSRLFGPAGFDDHMDRGAVWPDASRLRGTSSR